jgi:DNA polymerase III delta prime subunit
MKHFIVEGPDGAGKTTYATALAAQFGLKVHHEGPPPADNIFGHYYQLLDRQQAMVFDRLHLGELVYGPLLRGKSGITFEQCRVLSDMALITICLPSRATCMAGLHEKEFITDQQQLEQAYSRWVNLVSYNAAFMHNAVVYNRTKELYVP